jgi:hypothetical protein
MLEAAVIVWEVSHSRDGMHRRSGRPRGRVMMLPGRDAVASAERGNADPRAQSSSSTCPRWPAFHCKRSAMTEPTHLSGFACAGGPRRRLSACRHDLTAEPALADARVWLLRMG